MKKYITIGYFLFLVIYPALLLIMTLNLDQDIDTSGWVFIGTILGCSYAAAIVVYYSNIKGKGLFKRKPKPIYIKIQERTSDNQQMILVPASDYMSLIILSILTHEELDDTFRVGLLNARDKIGQIIDNQYHNGNTN